MAEVTLSTKPGGTGLSETFTEREVRNLKQYGTFKYAKVTRGTYIFIAEQDFDPEGTGSSLVVYEGAKDLDISNVNGSFYCLPDVDRGIVLFAHVDFRGTHKYYEESDGDITGDFPPNTGQGVSACILMSPNESFRPYSNKNFDGVSFQVQRENEDPIDKYRFLPEFNDKTASLRKI